MTMATQEELAKVIVGLSYIDMTELGDALASSTKADVEDDIKFDGTDRDHWCERLRWWAVSYLDALEDDAASEQSHED